MKALSIHDPHVTRIVTGQKTIETRTWPTKHRGDLLICATMKATTSPAGHAVAIATLHDCRPMTPEDAATACVPYQPGLWAWVLTDVKPIAPVRVKGQQGLFNVSLP